MSHERKIPAILLMLTLLAAGAAAASTGSTRFLTGPRTGDPVEIARGYVRSHLSTLGLTESDVSGMVVASHHVTAHSGVTHVYLTQRARGIEVFNGVINVSISSRGEVISAGNRFVADLAGSIRETEPNVTAGQAVLGAARRLGLSPSRIPRAQRAVSGPARETVFDGDGISIDPIHARLMWLPLKPGNVRLVWDMTLSPDDGHLWLMHVDAVTGDVLTQRDMMQRDSYKVYAWPAESPNHVAGGLPVPPADGRSIVTEAAADPAGSPFGWHDLDGIMGGDTVDTSGNNVFAQTDLDNNNAFVPGVENRPFDPFRDFQHAIDLAQGPETYRDAAVTNLFYWNNILHDIHYLYGFTEAAGNFQLNNYGRGGLGADQVEADAQDGSGTNNANFGTPADGRAPRMQMYVWLSVTAVQVNSPYAAAYPSAAAGFGAPLDEVGVTADVALADDGTGTTSDACEPLPAGSLSGLIALVDRGTCEFGLKVKNAQDAGAVAAIVVNNAGDGLVGMSPGATGAQVTIPSVFIGQTHGNEIRTALQTAAVNVTLKTVSKNRDSDLDSGVIAHEYGHGVSTRLTGGPANVACLTNDQQAGEGWSDWWALALTARAGATGAEPRGIGTYLVFQDPPDFGGGIRPFPYSTDMTINPQTYGDLATGTLSVPHGVGTVWAATLWDMHWNIVNGVASMGLPGAGFRQNLYDLTPPIAGNQIALQLVMDGLKMQPCNPSFLDGRDAILAADDAAYGGAHRCHIWAAFARRGMGVGALDGGGTLDVTEDFTLPAECTGGPCQTPPTFAGATGVTASTSGTCQLTVSWEPATDNCASGGVTYDVHRSLDASFTPGAGTLIASGQIGVGYVDRDVTSGQRYHYIVRAVDGLGNQDRNTVRRSEIPAGTLSPGGTFSDDAGDTGAQRMTPAPAPNPWTVRPAGGVGGSRVYATSAAGNYTDRSCMTLESETIYLGASPALTFSTKYDIEPGWDGAIVEVSTAAGGFSDWRKLDTITYPGVMAGPQTHVVCTNPGMRDGETVFSGTTGGQYLPFSGSLSAFANQAVRIRFVFGSDDATNDLGMFVDDVTVSDVQQPGACSTLANRPPIAADDSGTTEEDTPVTLAVLANDTDPDGDTLAVSGVTDPPNGSAADNGDGTLTYTPDTGFTGLDTFSYTIQDGAGGSDTATVSLRVNRDADPNACLEIDDADAAVEYRGGWHRREDARASNGGYHRRMGKGSGGSSPSVKVVFDGDSVTYFYVMSDIGGTADVYIDGTLRETMSYGPGGSGSENPTFGHRRTWSGLGDGRHELRIVHRAGAVYVDGFGFSCAEAGAGADPDGADFHSVTRTGSGSSSEGLVIERDVTLGSFDRELSVVVEGSVVPLTVRLVNPLGEIVATGQALIPGLTASGIDAGVSRVGTWKVQVLNMPGAFGTIQISIARTVAVKTATPATQGSGVRTVASP